MKTFTTTRKGYAQLFCAQPVGAAAEIVRVEADLTRGLHAFSIIGLTNRAVDEARDRINAAIRHAGFPPPKASNKRMVLSLSPADLKKEGSHYDLALALSYLVAAGEIPAPTTPMLFSGELTLSGELRSVRGILPQVLCARRAGIDTVFVPQGNVVEALLVPDMCIYAPRTLEEVVLHLAGTQEMAQCVTDKSTRQQSSSAAAVDLRNIKGQESAKRALEIAAAGGHHIVLHGPPGTGKTMLAHAVQGILPPLTQEAVLEATAMHSTAGTLASGEVLRHAPFRSPHHTVSAATLVGGGVIPRPGEVTLAHHGVLFLDEVSEFRPEALEALRQPLEDGRVTVARAKGSVIFPSVFMLVGAMNPPDTLTYDAAGMRHHARKQSRRLSRPIIDRIDLWVPVPHVPAEMLGAMPQGETSSLVRARVTAARAFAGNRWCLIKGSGTHSDFVLNAQLPARALEEQSGFTQSSRQLMRDAANRLTLSPRSYHRTMRVARTIADLAHSKNVHESHCIEALQYRPPLNQR